MRSHRIPRAANVCSASDTVTVPAGSKSPFVRGVIHPLPTASVAASAYHASVGTSLREEVAALCGSPTVGEEEDDCGKSVRRKGVNIFRRSPAEEAEEADAGTRFCWSLFTPGVPPTPTPFFAVPPASPLPPPGLCRGAAEAEDEGDELEKVEIEDDELLTVWHVEEQVSPEVPFFVPSSHASLPAVIPSPHVVEQTLNVPEQEYPDSTMPVAEQPSPFVVFPSSHCSSPSAMPFPHVANVTFVL